jgi:hypothetical protein
MNAIDLSEIFDQPSEDTPTLESSIDDIDDVADDEEIEDDADTPTPAEPVFGASPPKVKYITNKELLAEIHKSKLSYCVYLEPKYAAQDCIVATMADINSEVIEAARIRKAHLQTQAAKAILRAAGAKAAALREAIIDPATIATEDIVIRVMTSAHIPLDPDRKRKGKGENSNHTRTPFLPFKHVILVDGEFKEVLRSHWRGDFETGEFDMHRGKMTHRLAVMFMMLVDRYSRRSNWRGYTYLDEMKSHALLQLSQIGLQFNEAVSDNPFAFYTTTIKNCFTRVLNLEKKNQNIRDDILIMHGASPSYTRQNDYEHQMALAREGIARANSDADTPPPADDDEV